MELFNQTSCLNLGVINMKRSVNLIIGALVATAFIAGSAFAEGGDCKAGQSKVNYTEKREDVMSKLNLTAEQDKMLKEAKASQRSEMEAVMTAIKAKREELKAAIAKPGATKKDIEPIVAELKGLEAEKLDKRVDGILKVKNILSPDQFQKLEKMKEGHRREGRGKHEKKEW